jgi:hypothetical protein
MPRARVAFAAAIATTFAVAAAACTLSDAYSSAYGEDAGTPGDASNPDDAGTPDTSDPVPIVDTGPVDSALDAGPWGDYCFGVPTILQPTAEETVGRTFAVSVQAPPCIKTMLVYMVGKAISPVIGPLDGAVYTVTVTAPRDEDAYVNANAWDNTNTPHESPHVGFHVAADH